MNAVCKCNEPLLQHVETTDKSRCQAVRDKIQSMAASCKRCIHKSREQEQLLITLYVSDGSRIG